MKLNEKGIAELIVVAVLATVLIGGTATVVASDGSKPGDVLYGIDRAAESAREALTFGDQAKTEFKLAQATERLEELEDLREENAPQDRVDEATDNYGATISEAASRLAEIAQNGGDIDEALVSLVTEATSVHLDTLAKVYENVPEQAKASIEKAMTSSEQGTEKALEALNGNVSEEKRQQIEERVQNSRALRGQPEDLPADQQGADNAEQGRSNAPVN